MSKVEQGRSSTGTVNAPLEMLRNLIGLELGGTRGRSAAFTRYNRFAVDRAGEAHGVDYQPGP